MAGVVVVVVAVCSLLTKIWQNRVALLGVRSAVAMVVVALAVAVMVVVAVALVRGVGWEMSEPGFHHHRPLRLPHLR